MTEEQKRQIEAMRQESVGYKKIAQTLGISLNTVKSYCRHHHLQGKDFVFTVKSRLKSFRTKSRKNTAPMPAVWLGGANTGT